MNFLMSCMKRRLFHARSFQPSRLVCVLMSSDQGTQTLIATVDSDPFGIKLLIHHANVQDAQKDDESQVPTQEPHRRRRRATFLDRLKPRIVKAFSLPPSLPSLSISQSLSVSLCQSLSLSLSLSQSLSVSLSPPFSGGVIG